MSRNGFRRCALAFALLTLCSASLLYGQTKPGLVVEGDHFTLDGKPFKVMSGELHYARIPREYWHARLKMARAMGLNTIATYVFWNLHEPSPGVYDFSGQNDLAAFIRAAQEEGLYVILRAGPYVCAEWELGGLPSWLLADPASAAALRSDDPAFMAPVERWMKRLAQEVAPLQVGNGGPILITQVENEYGGFGSDHVYMRHMRDILVRAGFTASMLDTVDGFNDLAKGEIPGVFAGVNFGLGSSKKGMDAAAAFRPGAPIFVTEYWPGWFDSWGHPHQTRSTSVQLDDLAYMLKHGAGVNLYMFHGGTSFGFMSGADSSHGNYLPDTTSYDYGAPLDESGRPTPKFYAMRKIFAEYASCGDKRGEACLPPVPASGPVVAIPALALKESASLWENLPAPVESEHTKTMEEIGQSYGYLLYRTSLPSATHGTLALEELHDYAQVYVDGKLAGTLDRREKRNTLALTTTGPARLDIVVENTARINYSKAIRTERKGITQRATLDGRELTGWKLYRLPMTALPERYVTSKASGPAFFRASFTLAAVGDTFLDTRALGKGAVWVNGHALGRFWNVGPQQTLYLPAPWLRTGANEIVVFDLMPGEKPAVAGLQKPILDAPVADQSGNRVQQ
ncbi:glycoside hydrolase family 35 protein [Granulicella rosea]|nr:beta-galactosidase [Granulicella rosea]